MPIDYENLRSWHFEPRVDRYATKDAMLYALSLGYGNDPCREDELPFVHETGTLAVPTLLATIGAPGAWATDPRTGIDWLRILHGEHRMRFHRAVRAEDALRSRTRVSHVVDKGAGKGALVVTTRDITDAATDAPVATIEHVSFCRSDGGFGRGDAPLPPLPAPPEDRPPDSEVALQTIPQAALLYRLNGDYNPIHILPAKAREAGMPRPILHGLCSYGMAARALVRACCDQQPERLRAIALRFSAPVLPGETLVVRIWRDGRTAYFQARVRERDLVVLNNGVAEIDAPAPQ
ncbi:MaoC family dehydratase [Bordetella genomosp. 13]|uniref:MaoC family dehydratase n=1 Tax=Bordetella genomosp. 13 TaxID=463040 RepID=UPI0011A473C7|nr:MaoC family dehydratase [Bordetella genomosp. 13]